MTSKVQIIAVVSLLTMAAIGGCKKETPVKYDCTGVAPTYTADVKSIIDNNCATSGCHSSSSKADGKDYSNYTAVKNGSSSNSFLGSMQHLSGYESMPKGGSKLSDAQLKTVACWVQNGTPQ